MRCLSRSRVTSRFAGVGLGFAVAGLVGLTLTGCGSSSAPRSTATPAPAANPEVMSFDAPPAAAGTLRTLDNVPMKKVWEIDLPSPVHATMLSPSIPDSLYVQLTGSHALIAFDRYSGKKLWTNTDIPADLTLDPIAIRSLIGSGTEARNDDRLYGIFNDILFCLDGDSGQVIWRMYLPFSPSSGPMATGTINDLRVFIGDWANHIQVVGLNPESLMPYIAWRYPLKAQASAPATINDNRAYVVDHAGYVNCFSLDRQLQWKTRVGGGLYGSPTIIGNVLFVGSQQQVLSCLNRHSGEELARIHVEAPITRMPFAFQDDPGFVYVWADADPMGKNKGLWCLEVRRDVIELTHNLDEQNRPRSKEVVRISKKFFVPKASRLVGSTPHHLLLMNDNSPVISAVDRRTGETIWSWDVNAGRKDGRVIVHASTYLDPRDASRMVFLVDNKNRMTGYRLFGTNDLKLSASQQ